jgi:hypothetical protein
MTRFHINEINPENNWILRQRRGRLELWEHPDTGCFNVEFYEDGALDGPMLLHSTRHSEEVARKHYLCN